MALDPMVFPEPPSRENWGFLRELKAREVRRAIWTRTANPEHELDLANGFRLLNNFPNEDGLLQTAFDDLDLCLAELGLTATGPVQIRLQKAAVQGPESYSLAVDRDGVTVTAEDREGMRRAIFFLEDQLNGQDGPFLPYGVQTRKPWVRNRISRCFFGPIKRPPFNRDELMDDMDYYPDEYLNRLAHEGINGLWLTVVFRELAETSFYKRDPDANQRLAKLRRTINQCLRYGIKTWIFAIEPRWLAKDDPLIKANPELAGAIGWDGNHAFCPSSPAAQQLLYETTKDIFTQLPGLGGFLNISHGERLTNCLSTVLATSNNPINCPRCGPRPKWQIHYDTTNALSRGMREANPEAEMISWLYQPQPAQERGDWVYELARHVPEGVVLQYNFESGAMRKQLDRWRSGGDYWLSYIGPSASFSRVAENAVASGAEMSAKIQVGCSHEVATVPFVSTPGLLYQKYKAMQAKGCAHVMQCWYFGNYPGIMNQAAGELAYETFEDSEADFLLRLARGKWGRYAPDVAEAWGHFTEAYSNYPLSNDMQYYGPMHAGITWPLFLKIHLKPLGPTWKPDFPPSGDTIGECLENHTLEEALLLATRMAEGWDKGMVILNRIAPAFANDRDRSLDIGVSAALGLQFRSARNILEFYLHRRELFLRENADSKALLVRLRDLVELEKANTRSMIELCRQDSRLGFHSEAEAHQYCEDRLAWRLQILDELLAGEFAEVEEAVDAGRPLPMSDFERNAATYKVNSGWHDDGTTRWRVDRDSNGDLVIVLDAKTQDHPSDSFTLATLDAAGTRFPWTLTINRGGHSAFSPIATCDIAATPETWTATVRLPALFWNNDPVMAPRYLYIRRNVGPGKNGQPAFWYSWPASPNPPRARLNLGAIQGDFCGRLV